VNRIRNPRRGRALTSAIPSRYLTEPLERRMLLAQIFWDGGPTGDGTNWHLAENWVLDALPQSGDTAVLDPTGTNPTITISQTVSVQAINTSRNLQLNGGTISGGTVNTTGGAVLQVGSSDGTLSASTVNGVVTMLSAGNLFVTGGLTLNGTASTEGASGFLTGITFTGTQTLSGTGSIVFNGTTGSNPFINIGNAGNVLTIGPNITIRTGTRGGNIGSSGRSIINQGTISAETSGQTLDVSGNTVTNMGTISLTAGALSINNVSNSVPISAASGTTLTLNGTWSNSSTITASNGTLNLGNSTNTWSNTGTITATSCTTNLGGSFTQVGLGIVNRTGGTVNITGTLTGGLSLDATTGSWVLNGGTISGGTVNTSGGAQLQVSFSDGTLNGLTVNGELRMTMGGNPVVQNGLTLNGTASIEVDSGFTTGMTFSGTQALNGNGTVVFNGTSSAGFVQASGAASVLTIGPNITIRTGTRGGSIGSSGTSLINQGTISAQTASQTLTVNGTVTNSGTTRASNGGTLTIGITATNFSGSTLTGGTWSAASGGTLRLNGVNVSTNAATIVLDGATSNIYNATSGTTSAVAGFTTNAVAGALTLANGRPFNFTPVGNTFVNSGTFTVNGVPGVTIAGAITFSHTGTIAGDGDIAFAGELNWTAGSMIGSGKTIIASGATLNIAQSTNLTLDRAIENHETIDWGLFTSASMQFGPTGSIVNDGLLMLHTGPNQGGNVTLIGTSLDSPGLTNNGTFSFSTQDDTDLRLAIPFVNNGTVEASTLSGLSNVHCDFPATHTGDFLLGAGTGLEIDTTRGGSSFSVTSSMTGGGGLSVLGFSAGNDVSIAGPVDLGFLLVSGPPALTCGGAVTLDTLNVNNGSATFNGATVVEGSPGDPSILQGTLGGDGLVTFQGEVWWFSGAMGGNGQTTIATGATVKLLSSSGYALSRTLANAGVIEWTAGNLTLAGGRLDNTSTGEIRVIGANVDATNGGGTNLIDNGGSLEVGTSAQLELFVPFDSSGEVSVPSGSLRIRGGGEATGTFDVGTSSASNLYFSDISYDLAANSVLTGGGDVAFQGVAFVVNGDVNLTGRLYVQQDATATFNQPVVVQHATIINDDGEATFQDAFTGNLLVLDGGVGAFHGPTMLPDLFVGPGGTLTGTADITFFDDPSVEAFDWSGGTIAGTGKLILIPSVQTTISGSNLKMLARTIENSGIINWTDGNIAFNGGTIDNKLVGGSNGTFNINAMGNSITSTGGSNLVRNHDTLLVHAGASVTIDVPFLNIGIVDVTGGSLHLTGSFTNLLSTSVFQMTGVATATLDDVSNYDDGADSLNGGIWSVTQNSTLNFPTGAQILTNNANITLSGISSSFPALNTLVTNNGDLVLGQNFTTAGSLTNNGTILVGTVNLIVAGNLDGAGALTQQEQGSTTADRFRQAGISNDGLLVVRPSGTGAAASVVGALTMGASAKLDLNDNDLILDYTGPSQLAAIQTLINSARAGGAWTGSGITSTAAKNANPNNTTLGVMEASDFKSIYGPTALFAGEAIDSTAVLVKYTYYGDTDFNGRVDFDDYSRTDSGFNQHKTGWLNGDFDGNGVVDFDDYSLIDLAFNTQGASLRPVIGLPGAGKRSGLARSA
jgi:hypothetical protein